MRGRIVNLASSIKQPVVNLILSNTYRVGIAGLAKKVYFELPSEGLLVNTLGPGRTSTERSAPFDEARAESLGVTRPGADRATPGTLRDVRGVRQSSGLPSLPGQHLGSEVQNRLSFKFYALLARGEKNVRFRRGALG